MTTKCSAESWMGSWPNKERWVKTKEILMKHPLHLTIIHYYYNICFGNNSLYFSPKIVSTFIRVSLRQSFIWSEDVWWRGGFWYVRLSVWRNRSRKKKCANLQQRGRMTILRNNKKSDVTQISYIATYILYPKLFFTLYFGFMTQQLCGFGQVICSLWDLDSCHYLWNGGNNAYLEGLLQ